MIISFLRFLINRTGKNGRRARAEILAKMPAREGRRQPPLTAEEAPKSIRKVAT